jgi:ribonuclease Z
MRFTPSWARAAAAALLLAFAATAWAQKPPTDAARGPASRFEVVLLGTGTPGPNVVRFGPSTLVRAGAQNLLFDTGRGVTIRLVQLGIPLRAIDQVFLTHFHSDHTNGLPDLWLTGWLGTPYASRKTPLPLTGPVGARKLAQGLESAYADDIRIRHLDEHLPLEGIAFDVHEFAETGGVVYERDGVKVIAFPNDHGDVIHPSVGYRVEYRGHAIVISGDTRPNENVEKAATGADLLVHEIAAAPAGLMEAHPELKPILAHHTTPPDAGAIFARANPKLAVYTHYVLLAAPGFAPVTPDELRRQTRERYDGPLVLGEDLMRFVIGDTVEAVPWTGRP